MDTIRHRWDLPPGEAVSLQKDLARRVDTSTLIYVDDVELVAGVDVSVKDNTSQAAIVVMRLPGLKMVESATERIPTPFPYIPGLLSFREGEVILAAREKLQTAPDVYIFDGAGIAHPRGIGIASHIGLWWDAPTVGCAKSYLYGDYSSEPGKEKGSYVYLEENGQPIGVVLRTRTNVKPVYVSPGHRATVDTARELVLACTPKYKLPEPIRAAHNLAGAF